MLAEALHVDTELFVLADGQTTLRSQLGIDQQILHLLIVDLDHAELHLELPVLGRSLPDALEDRCAGDGHNADVCVIADL